MVVKLVNRDKDGGTFVSLISKEQEWLCVKGVLPRVTMMHSYFRNSYPLLFTTPSMNVQTKYIQSDIIFYLASKAHIGNFFRCHTPTNLCFVDKFK